MFLWAQILKKTMKTKTAKQNKSKAKPKRKAELEKNVRVGMLFFYDQMHVVESKHETLQDNWWCRGVDADCGLWVFSEPTILRNQR